MRLSELQINKSQFISLLLLLAVNPLSARIFFVGSNPFLTVFAYPQDIFKVPQDFAYYYLTYQRLPWWGDIDEPTNKPNDDYISAGEKLSETSGTCIQRSSRSLISTRTPAIAGSPARLLVSLGSKTRS